MDRKEELEFEIIRDERRLADLKADVEKATAQLAVLREQLAAYRVTQVITPHEVSPATAIVPATNAAKVALFRSLFRGRENVFPRRWENARKGRSGYSPACGNEWAVSICEKKKGFGAGRRATCCECPNQAFIPVSDGEMRFPGQVVHLFHSKLSTHSGRSCPVIPVRSCPLFCA